MARKKKPHDPFRWFDSSPEVIRLVVMMYVKYPLSLRNVEDLLHERGIDVCHGDRAVLVEPVRSPSRAMGLNRALLVYLDSAAQAHQLGDPARIALSPARSAAP